MRRRDFVAKAGLAGGSLLVAAPSVRGLVGRMLAAQDRAAPNPSDWRAEPGQGGYGPLEEAGPELALPRGFRYVRFGVEGSRMSDGHLTPRAHDGMAVFPTARGRLRLLRNHEDASSAALARRVGPVDTAYDPLGGGGTTTLEVGLEADGTPVLLRDWLSLNGTIYNCAGGPTPWATWLTCEEITEGPHHGWERPHGYVFEVPAWAGGPVEPVPLSALGRFVHEAVAVDPETGLLYLTEDRHTSGFYRFRPARPGRLEAGGRLEMLAVRGSPRYVTRRGQTPGQELPVRWVPISEPDPPEAEREPGAVFGQGFEAGGAVFSRLEGCWWGDGGVYFHATDGGDARLGQVWHYAPVPEEPQGGRLVLVFESPHPEVLEAPDNITVSPRGGIVICEDQHTSRLRGLTPEGRIFDLADNILNGREFAGACFSPGGRVLFVNIQGDLRPGGPGHKGMTLAIWGPWERGAL